MIPVVFDLSMRVLDELTGLEWLLNAVRIVCYLREYVEGKT